MDDYTPSKNAIKRFLLIGAWFIVVFGVRFALRFIPGELRENAVEATTMTVTTCTTSTTTETTTTTTTMTTTVTTTTTEPTTTTTTTTYDFKDRLVYVGEFYGTYYHGRGVNPCPGGSGRMLEDCTPKDSEMKGSVACRAIQETYDYYVNGRTRVYLELPQYPEMNGWYWVDDACLYYDNVDFYFINYSDCPWYNDGITEHINLWVEPS